MKARHTFKVLIIIISFLLGSLSIHAVTSQEIHSVVATYGHWEIQNRIDALIPLFNESTDPVKAECALALGYSELINQRAVQAIPYLEYASNSNINLTDYSRLLLARAYFESGRKLNEALKILEGLRSTQIEPIRHDTLWLQVMIEDVSYAFDKVVLHGRSYLETWPDDPDGHLIRWKQLQALRSQKDKDHAFQLAEDIYYNSPDSPFFDDTVKILYDLKMDGVNQRTLTEIEHLRFIKELRRLGHHKQALNEIEFYMRTHPGDKYIDEICVLKADCHHNLWENDACLKTIDNMLQTFHRSDFRDDAILVAIKSARRIDNPDQVEKWCNRLIETFPGTDQALEGMYNLACFMSNYSFYYSNDINYKRKAEKWFLMLINSGGESIWRRHSLWHYAWFLIQNNQRLEAVRYLDTLIDEFPTSDYRWPALYWSGRFHNLNNNRDLALNRWTSLIGERPFEYYGQKALQQLRKYNMNPGQLGRSTRFPTINTFSTPSGRIHFDRALALKNLGLYDFSARELEIDLKENDTLKNRFHYCQMLGASGQTREAIRQLPSELISFISQGGIDIPDEFWEIIYPFHFFPIINREAINNGVDPWLVVALIKHESNFNPYAKSNVGAVGLMQIMPGTAQKISEDMKMPGKFSISELFKPEMNIRLGVFHIKQLVNEYELNWVPAVCSYNAGINPVKKWIQTIPMDDIEEWIERIPYHATRIYVKNILSDMSEYQRIYDL